MVLATLALLTLARAKAGQRGVLLAVAVGLGGLAVADSAFVYLVNLGTYASGNLISAGWVVGFLLICAGALSSTASPDADLAHREVFAAEGLTVSVSRLPMLLPYLPLVAAEAVVSVQVVTDTDVPLFIVALGFALVALVLARLIDVVGRPCVLDGVTVQVAFSVGVATPRDLEEVEGATALGALAPSEESRRLLRAADRAMDLAKATGKGQARHATAPAPAPGHQPMAASPRMIG